MYYFMNKKIIPIKGMHCRSCEILIEDELLKIPGVESCSISHHKGTAEIFYQNHLDQQAVEEAISNVGYSIGLDNKKAWISTNSNDWTNFFVSALVLFVLFYILRDLGFFNIGAKTSGSFSNLAVVLLIGLTAGFSTCMALVGGLVLGASASFAKKHPESTNLQKFTPHIFFNLGRIISFIILGAAIGAAGSFFQLSTSTLGFLTIAVGGVMLLLGVQLTELFPRLNNLSFTLPKSISRVLGIKNNHEKEYSHKNSIIMGGLTFFLPCGFTQAMQLYAISTGSPLAGALTMGTFALGTAPGLLGIGGLTSVIKGAFAKSFFKFVGLIVVFLAIFNISNGFNLAGINPGFFSFNNSANAQSNDPNVIEENGVQIVKMTQSAYGYSPNSFTIKKGMPVRWIINSEDINTCAASIASAKLGIRQGLQLGENVIEFTPNEAGTIRFSCAMGMYTGSFNVVSEDGASSNEVKSPLAENNPPVQRPGNIGGGCGGGGQGGCGGGCGGGRKYQPQANVTPVQPTLQVLDNTAAQLTPIPTIAPNLQPNTIQVIKAAYTQDKDIQPNQFELKAGIPARLEIEAKESGYGCMGSMALPGLSNKIEVFTAGKTMVFEFTPAKGSYYMTCAMGVPRGLITVN